MPPTSSAHCTFSAHFLFPDYTPPRHCVILQALQPLLPSSLSLQHSAVELGILASRFQPFIFSGAQPAASSSYASSTDDAKPVCYGNASDDTDLDLSSKKKKETAGSSIGVKQEGSSNKEQSAFSGNASLRSSDSVDTYPSDAKEAINASISQVQVDDSDSEPSMLEDTPPNEFKRLRINLDLEIYRAKCLYRAREFEQAEKILRQCIKDWPTDGRAFVALGTRLMKLGRFVDARAVFEDGCQAARGENPYIWQAWGWMEWKEGNLNLARQYYKKALSINSRSVEAARSFHAWAVLEEGAENYAAARELFKCTLRVDPQNAPAWTSWAKLEENVGNGIRAEEIRMQYLQQRIEVVDEAPWDVSFSSVFAPAINRIKEFFKIQLPAYTDTNDDKPSGLMPEIMEVLSRRKWDMEQVKCDENFDLEAFITEVLPWKTMSQSRTLRQRPKSVRITTVAF